MNGCKQGMNGQPAIRFTENNKNSNPATKNLMPISMHEAFELFINTVSANVQPVT